MPVLNYLSLAVRDYQESRNWYAINLGLKVEFEVPGDRLAAMQDDTGLTIFLQEEEQVAPIPSTVLYFQVESAEAMYRQLAARGVEVVHPPQMQPWGFGMELRDPTGYRVRLWDEETMPASE